MQRKIQTKCPPVWHPILQRIFNCLIDNIMCAKNPTWTSYKKFPSRLKNLCSLISPFGRVIAPIRVSRVGIVLIASRTRADGAARKGTPRGSAKVASLLQECQTVSFLARSLMLSRSHRVWQACWLTSSGYDFKVESRIYPSHDPYIWGYLCGNYLYIMNDMVSNIMVCEKAFLRNGKDSVAGKIRLLLHV